MPTHERYEQNLCKTGFNFYSFRVNKGDFQFDIKDWNSNYGETPHNYILLDPDLQSNQIPKWINFDLVLSQNRFGQYQLASQFSKELQIPLVCLEHTLPVPQWPEDHVKEITNMRGHENIYISEYSMKKWGSRGKVIHHGIDQSIFKDLNKQRENKCLTVVNDFINRDWCCGYQIWEDCTRDIAKTVVGDTPGLSLPAKSINHLVDLYNTHSVYINTSTVSPVPTALMEAMACGMAIVSTDTCMIPEIIDNGYNGYLGENWDELREFVIHLLEHPEEARVLGANAKETIEERFNLQKFVDNWRKVLLDAANIPYKGEYHA